LLVTHIGNKYQLKLASGFEIELNKIDDQDQLDLTVTFDGAQHECVFIK
jgi:hypothetical protein